MDSIYRNLPTSHSCTFDVEQMQPCRHSQKKYKNRKMFSQQQLGGCSKNYLTSPQHFCGEDVMMSGPVNLLNTLPQKPWFNVIRLGSSVRPDQVEVKLNPLARVLVIKAYPRSTMFRSTGKQQQIQHLLSLPKTIRMDKLQVRLTQNGDLVVIAPFKFSTQQQQQGLYQSGCQFSDWEDQMLTQSPFFHQQHQSGCSGNPLQQWSTIAIRGTNSRYLSPSTHCNTFGTKGSRSFYQGQGRCSSESETSSESDCSTSTCSSSSGEETSGTSTSGTSSSESESECETTTGSTRRMTSNWPISKIQVQKYLYLVQKIFYPNVVVAKIVPKKSSTYTSTSTTTIFGSQQQPTTKLQLVLDIKFVDFQPENQVNVRLHETKPNVLIVEGKKVRQDNISSATAMKYVRREIPVPNWLNVEKMVFGVKTPEVLRIKLPFCSNITSSCFGQGTFTNYSVQYPSTCGTCSGHQQQHKNIFGGCGDLSSQNVQCIKKSLLQGGSSSNKSSRCQSRY